jgi:hypothetical protein
MIDKNKYSPQSRKYAEIIYFIIAVDPPNRPADRKVGKHKG